MLNELLEKSAIDLEVVDCPEIGEGKRIAFNKHITVDDALSLPGTFPFLAPAVQSIFLFRILAREITSGARLFPTKATGREDEDRDRKFQDLPASLIVSIFKRSGLFVDLSKQANLLFTETMTEDNAPKKQ